MIGERINGSTAGQLRRRLLRHQLDWSPWLDRGLCPTSDRHCSDEGLHQHQLRSLSRSWRSHPWSLGAQRQHCRHRLLEGPTATVLFFWTANLYPPPPPPRVSLKQLLQWNYAELSLQQPCKNFVEFRWRNLRQSPIYRSPVESGRESARVWSGVSSI